MPPRPDPSADDILAIPGNKVVFDTLTSILRDQDAIAFVGAGVSAGLYPLWGEFVDKLADHAVAEGKVEQKFADRWKADMTSTPQQRVNVILRKLGDVHYSRFLKETFGPRMGGDGRRYTGTHAALLRLPFLGYVTTNYDPAIEFARMDLRPGCLTTGTPTWQDDDEIYRWYDGEAFKRAGDCPILWLHGSWQRPDGIVLNGAEYFAAYKPGLYRKLFEASGGNGISSSSASGSTTRNSPSWSANTSATWSMRTHSRATSPSSACPWVRTMPRTTPRLSPNGARLSKPTITVRAPIFYPAHGNDHSAASTSCSIISRSPAVLPRPPASRHLSRLRRRPRPPSRRSGSTRRRTTTSSPAAMTRSPGSTAGSATTPCAPSASRPSVARARRRSLATGSRRPTAGAHGHSRGCSAGASTRIAVRELPAQIPLLGPQDVANTETGAEDRPCWCHGGRTPKASTGRRARWAGGAPGRAGGCTPRDVPRRPSAGVPRGPLPSREHRSPRRAHQPFRLRRPRPLPRHCLPSVGVAWPPPRSGCPPARRSWAWEAPRPNARRSAIGSTATRLASGSSPTRCRMDTGDTHPDSSIMRFGRGNSPKAPRSMTNSAACSSSMRRSCRKSKRGCSASLPCFDRQLPTERCCRQARGHCSDASVSNRCRMTRRWPAN